MSSRPVWMQDRPDRNLPDRLVGFSISALLHGLVVAVVLVVGVEFPDKLPEPRNEPFRWEVSLITAPPPDPVTSDVPATVRPKEAIGESTEELATAMDASPLGLLSPAQPSEGAQPDSNMQTHSISQTDPTAARSTMRNGEARVSDRPERQAGLRRVSTGTHEPLSDPVPFTTANAAVPPPPVVEASDPSPVVQEPAQLQEPIILQRPAAVERPMQTLATMPDYGWLADTLWAEVQRFKQYPPMARLNQWEGRVVVQVSVRKDGRLINPEIQKSSGYPVLDQAAVAVIQQASPVALKYALGREQVAVMIPLNYQLE